jgi:hypothetical protein
VLQVVKEVFFPFLDGECASSALPADHGRTTRDTGRDSLGLRGWPDSRGRRPQSNCPAKPSVRQSGLGSRPDESPAARTSRALSPNPPDWAESSTVHHESTAPPPRREGT